MKRDLKKWLRSGAVCDLLNDGDDFKEYDSDDYIVHKLLHHTEVFNRNEMTDEDLLQFIWCEAQKQFLKNILDDIDDSLDKLFAGTGKLKGDKAQLAAYESSVKQWLYNKYHYLKRKNNG